MAAEQQTFECISHATNAHHLDLDICDHPSELLSRHELGQLLDEGMTDAERIELEEAETVCRAFLAWDLDKDATNVKHHLTNVLGVAQ